MDLNESLCFSQGSPSSGAGIFDSQPPTQPLSGGDSTEEDDEDEMEVEEDSSWGILYPNKEGVSKVCLRKENVSFGRSTSNDVVFTEDMMGKRRYISCSKVHFLLLRIPSENLVYIEDKSSNGTFVNGVLIGKGHRRPLLHNSYISIAESKWKPYVFMFKKSLYVEDSFPKELSRKYVVSGELGKGACGLVRLGFRLSDDKRVAIKIINKAHVNFHNRKNSINVLNEVKILQSLSHPCIIRLEDVIDTDTALYIILELADGGELFDKIIEKKKLSESDSKFIFHQIASAIKYLHSKNIAHRDLKPENILLDSNEPDKDPLVKITDMGLSKLVDIDSVLKTFCGTPQYLAPEVLTSRVRGDGTYSHKVDCWSMGVILYILLTGCPPFSPERRDGKELIRQIAEGDYSFDRRMWSNISDEAIDLVKKLLTVDVSKRLSAAQILNHPWIKNDSGNTERVLRVMKITFKTPENTKECMKRVHSDSNDFGFKKARILIDNEEGEEISEGESSIL